VGDEEAAGSTRSRRCFSLFERSTLRISSEVLKRDLSSEAASAQLPKEAVRDEPCQHSAEPCGQQGASSGSFFFLIQIDHAHAIKAMACNPSTLPEKRVGGEKFFSLIFFNQMLIAVSPGKTVFV
jgi:hypothetical protein